MGERIDPVARLISPFSVVIPSDIVEYFDIAYAQMGCVIAPKTPYACLYVVLDQESNGVEYRLQAGERMHQYDHSWNFLW